MIARRAPRRHRSRVKEWTRLNNGWWSAPEVRRFDRPFATVRGCRLHDEADRPLVLLDVPRMAGPSRVVGRIDRAIEGRLALLRHDGHDGARDWRTVTRNPDHNLL